MRRIICVGLLAFSVSGCDEPVREEMMRVPSPDGEVEAIVLRVNAHSTVAFSYEVYVAPPGERDVPTRIAGFYRVHSDGEPERAVTPVWLDDRNLQITFGAAQMGDLLQDDVVVDGRRIRLTCRGSVSQPGEANRCLPRSDGPA